MLKKVNNFFQNKIVIILIKLFFILSAVISVWMVPGTTGALKLITVGLSLLIFTFLTFKFDILKKAFINKNKIIFIISLVLTAFLTYYLYGGFNSAIFGKIESIILKIPLLNSHPTGVAKIVVILISALSYFALFVFCYYFYNFLYQIAKNIILTFDRTDITCFLTAIAVFIVGGIIIYSITNVFCSPTIAGKSVPFDVIFTTDTGRLIEDNVFMNFGSLENDIRQPLFTLFSVPFALPAYAVSKILFFIPNSFSYLFLIVNILLLIFTISMIIKLFDFDKITKILVFTLLIISYPTILFSINLEQYVVVQFFVVLTIYAYLKNKECLHWAYLGATGTLTTSAVLFPLIFKKENKLKKNFLALFFIVIQYIALVVISNKLNYFTSLDNIEFLLSFSGEGLSFGSKILQYINFIATTIVAPVSIISATEYTSYSYQMATATSVNVLGIIILALAVLGFALNYKNKLAIISISWVGFSFVLLCLFGWGTAENGLILYSLYFSFAFITLIVLLIEKLFAKYPIIKYVIYGLIIVGVLVVNVIGVYDLLKFATAYYPI